jgi:hypothetical protein
MIGTKNTGGLFSASKEVLVSDCLFKGNIGKLFTGGKLFKVRNCKIIGESLQTDDVFLENSGNHENYPILSLEPYIPSESCNNLYPTGIFSISSAFPMATVCGAIYNNQHYVEVYQPIRSIGPHCLIVTRCTFYNVGSGSYNGGCIYASFRGYANITDSSFISAYVSPSMDGGAVYLFEVNTIVLRTCCSYCTAACGVAWFGGSSQVSDSTMYDDTSTSGTIYASYVVLALTNTNFTECDSAGAISYYYQGSSSTTCRYITGFANSGACLYLVSNPLK